MAKKLGLTFVIGGCLAVIAQVLFNIVSQVLADPSLPLAGTLGPDVLVLMAMLGGVTGGLGLYRHLDEASSMGASIPFSGFAFGIGNLMISHWTKKRPDSALKCFGEGVKTLVWYNVVVFALTFVFAAVYYFGFGITDSSAALLVAPLETSVSGPMLYLTAFVTCGVICTVFEFVRLVTKIPVLNMLMIVWLAGAVLAPTGLLSWLASFGGWGVEVTVLNGGFTLYKIAFMLFSGTAGGVSELMVLIVTILCLFTCACMCWGVHHLKFGHKPQDWRQIAEGRTEGVFVTVDGAASTSGDALELAPETVSGE